MPRCGWNARPPVPAWPARGEDESYMVDIPPGGGRLQPATVAGALRGFETFAQLIAPAVHIEDRPRFAWHWRMSDVSRHWMPLEVVERNLDATARVELNVFHWHLRGSGLSRGEQVVSAPLQAPGRLHYTQNRSATWRPTRATAASA